MMEPPISRDAALAMDAADPLNSFRDQFHLPDSILYFVGNSLGAKPIAAMARAQEVIEQEWGEGLVGSWNEAGWFAMALTLGDRLAPLIGAGPGEVAITDSTGINLYKALSMALAMRPDRKVIVMERDNFPTDNYVAQGLIAQLHAGHEIRFVDSGEIASAIDESVAAVSVTDVHYKTGRIADRAKIVARAHEMGALAIFDLCHSAGAMPVALNEWQADFAVGCTYKYLNCGPGGPGYIFVAKRHQGKVQQPLTGWWGHEAPFGFEPDYRPAPDIRQALSGTQPILSMAMVEVGLEIIAAADMSEVRKKSMALGDLFVSQVDEWGADHDLKLASPREAEERGSQVSYAHDSGYAIMRALIAAGVHGDFRAPDIIRFGFAPLYNRYVDVWDAAEALRDVLETGSWENPEFARRAAVT